MAPAVNPWVSTGSSDLTVLNVRALRTAAEGAANPLRLKQTLCMQINHLSTIIVDPFSAFVCLPSSPGDEELYQKSTSYACPSTWSWGSDEEINCPSVWNTGKQDQIEQMNPLHDTIQFDTQNDQDQGHDQDEHNENRSRQASIISSIIS
eukprot:scaffold855_cov98-Skeletonema_marinoi.AAC.2